MNTIMQSTVQIATTSLNAAASMAHRTVACAPRGVSQLRLPRAHLAASRVARLTVQATASAADFESFSDRPIEVVPSVEDSPMPPGPGKVVVLGGNGFVGSAVCKEAIQQGLTVTSINRSGPPAVSEPWVDEVEWVNADVFDESSWAYTLPGASAVISCIGGFATTAADMERICGDATIAAVGAAVEAGVPRFIFVSVHDYNIPEFLKEKSGYFSGKKRAEEAVLLQFPLGGTVLRPGFIYGSRLVSELGVSIPLNLVGEPVQKILAMGMDSPFGALVKAIKPLPASDILLAAPVSVEAVAMAALKCVSGAQQLGVVDIDAIQNA
mmetsp:Transcript_38672/g.65105  ORF Transcript_38672/g.65105 Transcript_38672/m.65105 type:complete len:325 (-) Transcript_38672:185-1159(-)|eukprot:CAMPEP_0198218104 /NCGR_PEP_ID=MMETSP1445-20131203/67381_1 /TAXON_ID=36898 /ORGANISM="Pyramimonas sp., Strain CCMP2087" /LENGTH=324 /DNA_ID=CAMNT_0043895003 /DNA_START=79 /DNA_END=1053 /DNA_ORIENTATION=+